jgi:sulfonate transport system ATP-binding protein
MLDVHIDIRRKAVAVRKNENLEVLGPIELSVPAGAFVALLGPSGAGKTTLLRILAGLDRDYEGSVSIGGRPIDGPGRDRGLVFQDPRLLPWMTVERNVAFALNPAERRRAADRIAKVLELVHLTPFAKAWPRQLSGGMAQRASLARALVNLPDVLLLDEPLAALDSFTRVELQRELEDVTRTTGVTSLLVTHDIDEALTLSDTVIVLSGRPATVVRRIDVELPRPRARMSAELFELRGEVFDLLDPRAA